MSNADKIADLEREIEKLKAAQALPPPAPTEREVAEWRDRMHAAAEARANQFVTLSPERRREMERACSTADLQDLVRASHRPQGPSAEAIPSSQTLTGVKPVAAQASLLVGAPAGEMQLHSARSLESIISTGLPPSSTDVTAPNCRNSRGANHDGR